MDIILYLLTIIQYLYQMNCWLLNFICRYIPLKQWAFDDSHSPKYQKYKIDELPLITDFRQDWTYKELIPYFEKRYKKKIRPISRRSDCDIPDDCTCPRCQAPKPYLYKNNGSKGQLSCKVCDAKFSQQDNRFSSMKLRCPHCGNTLVPKKNRKFFILHKCVNPKCPYYLHNLKKVDPEQLKEAYGKNKYKLHYIYREFTVDFFRMDLNSFPKNASSLKFSRHNAHVMGLCLTFHVNLGLSLRKTSEALKDLITSGSLISRSPTTPGLPPLSSSLSLITMTIKAEPPSLPMKLTSRSAGSKDTSGSSWMRYPGPSLAIRSPTTVV